MKKKIIVQNPKVMNVDLQNQIKLVPGFISEEETSGLLKEYDTPMNWTKGRSGKYYRGNGPKLPNVMLDRILTTFKISTDRQRIHFLKMPEDSSLIPHTDDIPQGIFQVLIMLQPAIEGGILHINNNPHPTSPGDALGFNANIWEHEVTKIIKGERRVLSIQFFLPLNKTHNKISK